MRISDWSSDVCSSDLKMGRRKRRGKGVEAEVGAEVEVATGSTAAADKRPRTATTRVASGVEAATSPRRRTAPEADERGAEEIGRASCRERECANVYI